MEVGSGALSPSNVPQKPKVCDSYVGDSSNILSGKSVKQDAPLDGNGDRCTDLPERYPAMSEMRLLAKACSSDSIPDNVSHFAGAQPYLVFEESEGEKESETGPFQTMPADRVPDSSRFPGRITLNRAEQRVKIESLRSRVSDWKGGHIDTFGELLLDDVFLVTKSHIDREFHVFLFEKLILFCKEAGQPPKGVNLISAFLKKLAAPRPPTLPEILIKGRIFFRHLIQAVALPEKVIKTNGLPYRYFPLQIRWHDYDCMESFNLCCRGEDQMRQWETKINDLVEELAISKI